MVTMDIQGIIQAVESTTLVLGPIPKHTDELPQLDVYTDTAHKLRLLMHLKTSLERTLLLVANHATILAKQHDEHTAIIKGILANPTPLAKPQPKKSAVRQSHTVEIAPKLYLAAHSVSSFAQVVQNGELFYVTPYNHFAIKLNGKLLHGNIGSVIHESKAPEKIKECKFAACNMDTCDFYHDPCKHSGSRDVRNYMANSWSWGGDNRRGEVRGRRLGNKDTLAADLANITAEEASKFKDQVFHDLLCALLVP